MKRILYSVFIFLIVTAIISGCGAQAPQPESENFKNEVQTEITESFSSSPAKETDEKISEEIKQPQEEVECEPKDNDETNIQSETSQTDNEKSISEEKDVTYKNTCSLSVKCLSLLNNPDKLKEEKSGLVPENGIIYEKVDIEFKENETVFDLLKREMKSAKIHLEFSKTPAFNSMYIEGIANIYAFDAGELSGWVYRVNGIVPSYSCSEYIVADGDNIEFIYTCNSGKDIN